MSFVIENTTAVTPSGVLEHASIKIEDSRIVEIRQGSFSGNGARFDARHCHAFPGFVDIHSDAIEKEIEPRPGAIFPLPIVLYELDKKLAACGITTMFHSVSFNDGAAHLRSNRVAVDIIAKLNDAIPRMKTNTKIHARYEITDRSAIPFLHTLMENRMVHLLSVMDHTPGQGQFREVMTFRDYYGRVYRKTDEELDRIIEQKLSSRASTEESLRMIIDLARHFFLPIASHDDDSSNKIHFLRSLGVSISEFPVTMDAARAASESDMHVCLGAPNIIRGGSQITNLSAREAIMEGLGDVIVSDYSPMSVLHAICILNKLGIRPLHEAVGMASINPARAVGIADRTGSLEVGKEADIVLVDATEEVFRIVKTFVSGREVFSTT